MLVMALDTATPAVTAGVVEGERVLGERATVNPRAHGELLTPQVLEVLSETGHRLAELDAIVVGCGPGPFTGLRVGMATAAAFGHAHGIPVYPVCSLDAVAAGVELDARVLVATDARRREVYWAVYGPPDGAGRPRLSGPHVRRPEDVPASIAGMEVDFVAGEMAAAYRDVFGLEVVSPEYPTPLGLVRAASGSLTGATEPPPLVPMYLRRPDATAPGPRKPVLTRSEE
jgi:tRNA threonylcarbamoyl adenosine modification protein YeaZ